MILMLSHLDWLYLGMFFSLFLKIRLDNGYLIITFSFYRLVSISSDIITEQVPVPSTDDHSSKRRRRYEEMD